MLESQRGYGGLVLGQLPWHARERSYPVVLGRWLTRDPLQYADGPSLYLVLCANPIRHNDPWGLLSQSASGDAASCEAAKPVVDDPAGAVAGTPLGPAAPVGGNGQEWAMAISVECDATPGTCCLACGSTLTNCKWACTVTLGLFYRDSSTGGEWRRAKWGSPEYYLWHVKGSSQFPHWHGPGMEGGHFDGNSEPHNVEFAAEASCDSSHSKKFSAYGTDPAKVSVSATVSFSCGECQVSPAGYLQTTTTNPTNTL